MPGPARSCQFDELADEEYQEARERYESVARLGDAFEKEVARAVALLLDHPEIGPVVSRLGARRCVLRRFPYSLIYMIEESGIRIWAVAHHKRRPGYWLNRLRPS